LAVRISSAGLNGPPSQRGRASNEVRLQIGSILSLGIVGIGLLVVGCATPVRHQFELSPGRAFNGSLSHALLVPINETESVPEGLEVGEKNVFNQLKSYLDSKGLSIETVDTYDYRVAASKASDSAHEEMLSAETNSISGQIDYSSVVPGLLANLDSDADLVILANMVIRIGESTGGRTTRWDGVKRRLAVPARMRMTGTESVASIFVTVYERDGTQVFAGYGGLDLLFTPNIREERFDMIPDRLQNLKHIDEGICIAFYPYFGRDEICH
jgi:hypothetical protein